MDTLTWSITGIIVHFYSPDSTVSQELQQSASISNFHQSDSNVPPPWLLLRLLSAPDGLAGDAKGPRHCGLGLPTATQQPGGSSLLGVQSPGPSRVPAFFRRPPTPHRHAAFDRLQLRLGRQAITLRIISPIICSTSAGWALRGWSQDSDGASEEMPTPVASSKNVTENAGELVFRAYGYPTAGSDSK